MAKQPKTDKPLTPDERLNEIGIDAICDMIEEDKSYQAISLEIGISKTSLYDWVNEDQERSARAKQALIKAARYNDDQALKVLEDLKPDSTPAEIARAREIAQHRRWRARSRSPKEYGDKITHSGDPENPIQTVSRIELVPFSNE